MSIDLRSVIAALAATGAASLTAPLHAHQLNPGAPLPLPH